MEPYLKGNNQIPCLIGNIPSKPENIEAVAVTNILWMLHHAMLKNGAKKWFAWYSERLVDHNPIQKISYLPIINASPTSDSIVLKTMEVALKLCLEVSQDYMVATYDLAMKALRI